MELAPLITTFGIIAVAELGDKTQLTAMSLCTDCNPKIVLLGAMAAFTVVGSTSILIGTSMTKILPSFWIKIFSSIIFLSSGVYAFVTRNDEEKNLGSKSLSLITSFTMIATMELGDKTQLATIGLTSRFVSPLLTFTGMILGFFTATVIAVLFGSKLDDFLSRSHMKLFSSSIFVLFGLLFLLNALFGQSLLWLNL